LIDRIDSHQLTQHLRRGTLTFSGVGGTKFNHRSQASPKESFAALWFPNWSIDQITAHCLVEALQQTTKATVPETSFISKTLLPGFIPECVVQRARQREQKLLARLNHQAKRTKEAHRRYRTLLDKKMTLIKSILWRK